MTLGEVLRQVAGPLDDYAKAQADDKGGWFTTRRREEAAVKLADAIVKVKRPLLMDN